MKKGNFGIGLVLGAVAGVVTGLLTAPKSGKETRAELKKKAAEKKVDIEKHVDTVKGKARDYQGRAQNAMESAKKEFRSEDENTPHSRRTGQK